jgi:cytochrome c biogenesis protein CcmG/thiol:disulfide interchange protein DsbE
MVDGISCTVVKIDMNHGVSEQLWIDPATHLVRKELFNELTSKEEVTFTAVHIGELPSADAFTYEPRATKAKNRTEIAQAAPELLVGKTAPNFALRDLDGHVIDLKALRGKPVLLDFWATWCGFCLEELPTIEMLHRGMQDKVAVFAVDNEEPELPREYLRKYGYTLRSLVDGDNDAVNGYHVDGWPTTVLIDGEGKVVFYTVNFEPEKLRDALRSIGAW